MVEVDETEELIMEIFEEASAGDIGVMVQATEVEGIVAEAAAFEAALEVVIIPTRIRMPNADEPSFRNRGLTARLIWNVFCSVSLADLFHKLLHPWDYILKSSKWRYTMMQYVVLSSSFVPIPLRVVA